MSPTSTFFVLCDFGTLGRSWIERDAARTDWTSLIEDLATGQIENMIEVREAQTWRDVTKDAAEAVANQWAIDDEPREHSQYAWIELHLGTRAARGFLRSA